MSIDRWLEKKAVEHVYSGILLGHKKKCVLVGSNEVDASKSYYTEWSKSEREKQISYISTYTWSLERWSWRTYLQGSTGDGDIENRPVHPAGEGEGGVNRGQHGNIHIAVRETDSRWEFAVWCRELKVVLWDHLEGWDGMGGGRWEGGSGRRGQIYTMADSCWCTADTKTIL